ncbi:MAG: hypothetical protein FWF98_02825 [Dehalococcoidia bacterium]|nr:hypothetical protein [Dehalococcoidia bacterium]
MRTKEEYYECTLINRKVANDPGLTACSCRRKYCEWHGKCRECVAIHRYHGDHIPTCLQPMLNDKLKELVTVGELCAMAKEKTPEEYRHYVRKRDNDDE